MYIKKDSRIMVTGGTGFLGKSVVRLLKKDGYTKVIPLSGSKTWDLTKQSYVVYALQQFKPEIIIHLAARVGGIGANQLNPGKFMYDNLSMGLNLIEASRRQNICKKFVMVGTVCSYPKFSPVPFKEEDIWSGYPEETNAPYGIAKKTLMQLLISYREQYSFNAINLVPVNMYGQCDNFNPDSSHVIPALIRKFHEAKVQDQHEDVSVWGTGNASREFLYVDDCARAIIMATEKHNDPQPVNIGTGVEITIKDLTEKISDCMAYNGKIIWNTDKPDGQPRRCLDTSKAKKLFGFEATTDFDTGLKKTVQWFKDKVTILDDNWHSI